MRMDEATVDGRLIDLHGMDLGQAFLKFVLGDRDVMAVAARFSPESEFRDVFTEGRFPGPYMKYIWPLRISEQQLGSAFGRTGSVSLNDSRRPPSPDEQEAARALVNSLSRFANHLHSGELIATGTAVVSGAEVRVSRGQWSRSDLLVDKATNAIFEMRDHTAVPVWTGVYLEVREKSEAKSSSGGPDGQVHQMTASRQQARTTLPAQNQCLTWLKDLMSNPGTPFRTVDDLWEEAHAKWPTNLGRRSFESSRLEAVRGLADERRRFWTRPGPRRKSPH